MGYNYVNTNYQYQKHTQFLHTFSNNTKKLLVWLLKLQIMFPQSSSQKAKCWAGCLDKFFLPQQNSEFQLFHLTDVRSSSIAAMLNKNPSELNRIMNFNKRHSISLVYNACSKIATKSQPNKKQIAINTGHFS